MKIAEASKRYDISADTLRYCECIAKLQTGHDCLDYKNSHYETVIREAEKGMRR